MAEKAVFYIGIDLSDPYARDKRNCTRAILGPDLECTFSEWKHDVTGFEIVPSELLNSQFLMAIDGPQGLAGSPERRMRLCEQQLRTAGKSPYYLPTPGTPYAGFVKGSAELFYSLYRSGRFCLYGMPEAEQTNTSLIEVYPGSAWPILAGTYLANKRLPAGRQSRYNLLINSGLVFSPQFNIEQPPTHDELDAAAAAYIAYLFHHEKTCKYGENPYEDKSMRTIREGFIIQPCPEK